MSSWTQLRVATALLTATALLILSAGCSVKGPEFVDANNSYDRASVMKLVESVDTTGLAGTPSSKAPDLRHEALTALRARGGRAAEVADLLTKTFSADTRAVPVRVERAMFDGKAAVVIVEAAGPPDGRLDARRVWVLDERGNVLFMGSSR